MEKTTILKRLEDVKGIEDVRKLITELRLDIVATNKVGKFNVKNYFKKFYNKVDEYRPAFKGFYKLNDKWIICDGYKLVELQNPKDNEIAEALEVVNKAENYTIDYENIKSPELTEHKIDMELLQKTLNYNKTQRDIRCKIPYIDNFDDKGTKIGINAEWLWDLLQLNNTDTVGYGTTPVSPVSITSEDYKIQNE